MMFTVAALALALRLLVADIAADVPEQGASAVQPVLSWQTALNAHDVERSVSVFSEDAVVIQPKVGGLPQVFVGRDEITWWVRNLVAQGVQVELLHEPRLDGDRVAWVGTLSVDAYRGLGVPYTETASEAVLSDGQISSLTTVLTPAGAKQLHRAPGVPGTAGASAMLGVSTIAAASGGFGIGLLLGRRAVRASARTSPVRGKNPLRV
jgi:hypothetical protein